MRRNHTRSPLPPDPAGQEDIMRPSPPPRAARTSPAPAGHGGGPGSYPVTAAPVAERAASASAWGAATPFAAALVVLAGLWVAISPWFVTLQAPPARNATAGDLIVGLAVVVIGLLAVIGARGVAALQAAAVLAGVWLIISPFILDAKYPVTTVMYWSNIWSGAVVIIAGLAVLAAGRARAAA